MNDVIMYTQIFAKSKYDHNVLLCLKDIIYRIFFQIEGYLVEHSQPGIKDYLVEYTQSGV